MGAAWSVVPIGGLIGMILPRCPARKIWDMLRALPGNAYREAPPPLLEAGMFANKEDSCTKNGCRAKSTEFRH